MESLAFQQATAVYGNIDRLDVARYYLESELPNLFLGDHANDMATPIHQSLANMNDKSVWRLLEALSSTYRLNSVFSLVSNQGYDWHEIALPISTITLTGINPKVNERTFSEEINRNPVAFAEYLKAYFAQHSTDDPEGLGEFRPRDYEVADQHSTLLVLERKGQLRMLDGSHRLMAYAMLGKQTIRCYCAVPNGKQQISNRGDSMFLELRRAYVDFPEQRQAILQLTEALAIESLDGQDAVKSYWVDHAKDPDIKKVGQQLLERITVASFTDSVLD